jgi:hAT family C-terminal dimerisation region
LENDAGEQIHDDQPSTDELEQYFHQNFQQTSSSSTNDKFDENIHQKILNLSYQAKLTLSENELDYWEMRRYDEPILLKISQVVLAVPATQASVERSFCALELVLTTRRNCLEDHTIDDLLVCKLNDDVFAKVKCT